MIAFILAEIHPLGWVLMILSLLVVLGIVAMIIQGLTKERPPRITTPDQMIAHHALVLRQHGEKDATFSIFATKFARLHHDLVPPSGAASSVQGEILRSVNRLAGEERRNGNMNWSEGYIQFVDFLRLHLLDNTTFDSARCSELSAHLTTVEQHVRQSQGLQKIDAAFSALIRAAVDFCEAHSTALAYTSPEDRTI